ncbi:hypothetical protein VTN77DRAFT_7547 [Rasamsonia byssochlamydoides]|uniref:uncharacterized protein n=1 Tax=Rasamsonia byssochlamydoides TaxID=89139 RepID=UPI0037446AD0
MSSDFWAGYISGAIGIIIGNPLDLVKVRLQASHSVSSPEATLRFSRGQFETATSLVRGAAAPILGYGALNALLYVVYNRSLKVLDSSVTDPTKPDGVSLYKIWLAGAAGGMASWVVSSPTELIKCRAQLSRDPEISSWKVASDIIRKKGWKGLYFGGVITSIRDSVGYGFYFWSYELCKRCMTSADETAHQAAMKVLICGGIAGIVTWASVFPLDVIKTRLQAQSFVEPSRDGSPETRSLLRQTTPRERVLGSLEIAQQAYRTEGFQVFYRGLGICSIRAFIVNAVQWAAYEWLMKALSSSLDSAHVGM